MNIFDTPTLGEIIVYLNRLGIKSMVMRRGCVLDIEWYSGRIETWTHDQFTDWAAQYK